MSAMGGKRTGASRHGGTECPSVPVGTELKRANFDIDLGDPLKLVQVILMEWAPLQVRCYSSEILCFDHRSVANLVPLLISQDAPKRD